MKSYVVATCIALAGCATESTTVTPPTYLSAEKSCAVVAGGSLGSEFADPKIEGFWHEVNRRVSSNLYEKLAGDGFSVFPLTVGREDDVVSVIAAAAARNRCNRVLQVEHEVSEDVQGKFFSYKISLMRLAATGVRTTDGTRVKTVGEYQRSYRFQRTPETFRTLAPEKVAAAAYAELKASGKLEPLRKP